MGGGIVYISYMSLRVEVVLSGGGGGLGGGCWIIGMYIWRPIREKFI